LLAAGAADESAGADDALVSGLAGAGVPPPQAARAPTAATVARRAAIAMFFMIVFSSENSPELVEDGVLMHQFGTGRQSRVGG
jgi:hypothetical protein